MIADTVRLFQDRRIGFCFLLFGILCTLSPFVVTIFPSQDGPAHLDTIRALEQLRSGGGTVSAIYREVDPGYSNLVVPWLLMGLYRALGPTLAEWSLALLTTAAILIAAVTPTVALRRSPVFALVAFPLAAPFMMYMGSISLVLGYAFAFVALGLAVFYLERRTTTILVAMVAFEFLAFFMQAQLAVGLLAAILGGATGVAVLSAVQRRSIRSLAPLGYLAAANGPLLLALLAYQASFSSSVVQSRPQWDLVKAVAKILLRREVVHFSWIDLVPHGLMFLAMLAAAAWWLLGVTWNAKERHADLAAEWAFAAAVAIFCLVLVLPGQTLAIPQIAERLLPVGQFCFYLWFLAALPGLRLAGPIALVALLGVTVSGVMRTLGHRDLSHRIEASRSVEEEAPSGSVIMPFDMIVLNASTPVSSRDRGILGFNPQAHHGRFYGQKDLVSLDNYQAQLSTPFFRIRYKAGWDEKQPVSEPSLLVRDEPTAATLERWCDDFARFFGRPVSHVIVFEGDIPSSITRSPEDAAVRKFLATRFKKIRESEDQKSSLWAAVQ